MPVNFINFKNPLNRLTLYEEMLSEYENKNSEFTNYGFCYFLEIFENGSYEEVEIYELIELYNQKPKSCYLHVAFNPKHNHRLFWWKQGSVEIRIKALKQAIKEVK